MAASLPDAASHSTIYALSSGRTPAAIAVIRVSGPRADAATMALAGRLPAPRRASLATLRDAAGEALDQAIVLRFPGPASATGEDLAEFHVHGGIAVIAAVCRSLAALGLREAEPGEFTRRALFAGRLDPADVEGLADLLAAETEVQRRDALRRADGGLARLAAAWHDRLLVLQALVERAIDHDEDDGDTGPIAVEIAACREALDTVLAAPPVERLRDGIRVVLTGPVNAGKSSLFNALLNADAAIVSSTPGTTRDPIERPVTIGGLPFVLIDTAGLRATRDGIEAEGVERAVRAVASADIVIDLSAVPAPGALAVSAKSDIAPPASGRIATSARTGDGIERLLAAIVDAGEKLLPGRDEMALDSRHRGGLTTARDALADAASEHDLVLVAEHVRRAVAAIGGLTGNDAVEALLDTLFARFCLGK